MLGDRVPHRALLRRISALGRRIGRDRRGSTLAMMAAAMIPLLAGVGSAVDIGRIYLVHSQMQAGVDAAALAGARAFEATGTGPESRTAQVEAYFRENFPEDFLGAGNIEPDPDFRVERGVNVTQVDAKTNLPMLFMHLFGKAPHPIAVTAVAEMQPRPLEIMVVLDDTGSMQTKLADGRSRMNVLKEAMHEFVDVLYQGSSTREDLALGIVTYTVTTNVGSVLTSAGVPIQPIDGYTNLSTYLDGRIGIGAEGLAWGGCVENDPSIQDIGSSATTFEEGAWDVSRKLPHEQSGGTGVRPYLYPPSAETDPSAAAYSTTGRIAANYKPAQNQSSTSDSRRNNLYHLTTDAGIAQILANTPAYRQHFYEFYIGLNANRTTDADDVIVRAADGGYYTPGSTDPWMVLYSRIPFITDNTAWAKANANYGYPLPAGTTKTLKMPTPNWQCPNPSIGVTYGRNKSVYQDYIDNHNHPLMPASGTLHHIGFLWGYRLLARDDIFTRTNPVPDQEPLRAIVFMTDGQTEAASHVTWRGA